MKIEHHIALSTAVSALLYSMFKSWELAISSLVAGIAIDIDHILDYFTAHGIPVHLNDFLSFFYEEKHSKIMLLFHGWEWLLCLGAVAIMTGFNLWVTGLLIGYLHHIVSDYLYSKANVLSYSLIWRWKNKFDSHLIFPRDRGYNP